MLMLFYVVGVDVVFLLENRFRVEQAAVQGLQVITQFTSLYDDDFTKTFFPIIKAIAGNGKTLTDATQIACAATISGLDYPVSGNTVGPLTIVWQRKYTSTDASCDANKVGPSYSATGNPVSPALGNYTPPTGVPFIVVEVASVYTLTGLSAVKLGTSQSQYSVAMAIPRQRVLPTITTGSRP